LAQSGLQYWLSLGFSIGSVWASVSTLEIAQTFISVIQNFLIFGPSKRRHKIDAYLASEYFTFAISFSFFHISKWLNFQSSNFLKYRKSLRCKEEGGRHFDATSNTAGVSGSLFLQLCVLRFRTSISETPSVEIKTQSQFAVNRFLAHQV